MIEVQDLTKYYGARAAVAGISFSAQRGEILGFLGPNGAGKTTTMRMLTCFLPPTRGTAKVAGFDILEQSMEVRSRVGYLPENVPLYLDLSVVGYLDFVTRLKGVPATSRPRVLDRVAHECGITEVWRQRIGTLSRGYRQRVGLAQALVNNPQVLILDEPTVGLDPRQIIEIRELIRGLAGERTVVLSTHILPEASLLCQRVIIINRGRLITDDAPENLARRLRHGNVIDVEVAGDAPRAVAAITAIDGVQHADIERHIDGDASVVRVQAVDGADPREAIARSLVDAGFGLRSLSARDLTLEDIFVELVTEEDSHA